MTTSDTDAQREPSPLPDRMRVAVLARAGVIELEERAVPVPGPGEVLIQVGSVGVCGSDVHYYRDGRIAQYVVERPMILGHEAGGTIVATGDGVAGSRIGERVALEPGIPCRHCVQCYAGRYNLCPEVRFFATPPIDGALAEYVTLDADFAHPVPDSVSDDAAGLIEPLSVGVWACRRGGVGIGTSVLITGAGPVGLMTTAVASAAGASRIVVTDIAPERLAFAREHGATDTIDVMSADASTRLDDADATFDVLIDCSGSPESLARALPTVQGGGRVVLVGMGADEVTVPLGLLQSRELTITGTFRYAHTYPAAIALAASGRIDLDALVSSRHGLDGTEDALLAGSRPGAIKAIIRPGETGTTLT